MTALDVAHTMVRAEEILWKQSEATPEERLELEQIIIAIKQSGQSKEDVRAAWLQIKGHDTGSD